MTVSAPVRKARAIGVSLAGAAALLIIAGAWILRPHEVALKNGALLSPPRPLPEFSLAATRGGTLDRAALRGHWSAIYPGYTHCPDACPTTLALLAHAMRGVPAVRMQVIFLSLDPARDSVAVLSSYVGSFDDRFIGATGSAAQLAAFASALSIQYSFEPPQAGGYVVDHSSVVMLVDPQVRVAGYLQPPFTAQELRDDLDAVARHS